MTIETHPTHAGAQPAPAQQSEALSLAQALDDNADLDAAEGGNPKVCQLERDAAAELRRLHVRTIALESQAAAKCLPQDAEPAPVTYMATDNACKWAWDQVREDVGTEGWTAGDSCTFHGFFLWGWNYRGQYETQRPAAPPAPAAVAVQPAALQSSILDLEAWEHRSDGEPMTLAETESVSLVLQELKRLRALAAAPAQAVAVPDERDAEIAGLTASVGHLSALVDGQQATILRAKAAMKALHNSASPIDESRGDLDARIPEADFRQFVDEHAALIHAIAQSPVAAAPAQEHATQGGSHGSA